MTPSPLLLDTHDRVARYLRLSVTDRCNLRCAYCRSGAETFIPHADILRYEEMLQLIDLVVDLGIGKVRVTGGEPFARKGVMEFMAAMRARHPALDIRLTTNGTLVAPHVAAMKEAGINAVNLSLDSFDPARFAETTGRDLLPRVLENIDLMLDAGLTVKLNAVAMRGVNDGELAAFLRFAQERNMDVRFIEFMPMGAGTSWSQQRFWPAGDILEAARRLVNLTPLPVQPENAGPARMYAMEGGGRLGLITPLSSHFCGLCNRLRLTADGRLRTCLFDDTEYRIRAALRHPRLGVQAVQRILLAATQKKPLGVHLLEKRKNAVAQKRMTAIGG